MGKDTIQEARVLRDKRTPETAAEEVFQSMQEIYVRSSLKVKNLNHDATDKQKENLSEKIKEAIKIFHQMLSEMYSNQENSGDQLEEKLQIDEEKINIGSNIDKHIEITLAYAIDGLRAYEADDINLAWSYVVDANFWAGQVIGASIFKYEKMSNATDKRHEKNRRLEKEIKQWYKDEGHKFGSKDAAAEQAKNIFELEFSTIRRHLRNL